MEKLKRSLSFRKKKDHVPECSKPHQWQEDERKVRDGTCSFQVRYLGCIEVFESRGMQVCEEAVKALKAKLHRSVWARMSLRKKKKDKDSDGVETEPELQQAKGKYQRAVLYVSGDALRVVDEISKGLIVDQTIEKVSFCAPDRNHEKGFAYICRDGTTRRWMCHGFLALKESGERLSHAVGCAFAICLEKKQKREKEAVSVQFNDKGTSFERTGSFRQATLTERLADPQSVMAAEPVPVKSVENVGAVSRPHAPLNMLERQGSFRGFQKLSESSPFKRQLSLRVNELPSTLERQRNAYTNGITNMNGPAGKTPVMQSSIPEVSPTKENPPESISEMCQQLTQGLSALTTQSPDPFSSAPGSQSTAATVHSAPQPNTGAGYTATAQGRNIPLPEPIRQTNPWASPPPTTGGSKVSDAEFWLDSTAKAVSATPPPMPQRSAVNGASPTLGGGDTSATVTPPPPQIPALQNTPQSAIAHRAPHLSHLRSHSIDTSDMWGTSPQRPPTLRELQQRGHPMAQFQSQQNGTSASPQVQNPSASPAGWTTFNNAAAAEPRADPFDAAWAAKAPVGNQSTNPFQGGKQTTVKKEFTVNL